MRVDFHSKKSSYYLIVIAKGRRRAQLVGLLRLYVLDDQSLFLQAYNRLKHQKISAQVRFPPPELCKPTYKASLPCCRDILYGFFYTNFSGLQALPLPPKDQIFCKIFLDFSSMSILEETTNLISILTADFFVRFFVKWDCSNSVCAFFLFPWH